MKNRKPIAAIIIVIAASAFGWWYYAGAVKRRAAVPAGTIMASGNIEVDEVDLSFKVQGRLTSRLVEEGDSITTGQLVATLDPSDFERDLAMRQADRQVAEAGLADLQSGARPQEIAQAEAAVQRAKAALDDVLAGARPQEISQADAAVSRVTAEVNRAEADFRRAEDLFDKDVLARKDYDAARAARDVLRAQLEQARQQASLVRSGARPDQIRQAESEHRRASEALALVRAGARKETVAQARARVQLAGEAVALSALRLSYARLASPVTGIVLSKNVEPGEWVSPGTPVVTVGDLTTVYMKAYIQETDLGKIHTGTPVTITTDSYPGKKYNGVISFISSQSEFTPKSVQTEQERVKLVYRIKIRIPNPGGQLKPGMPADALFSAK